MNLATCPPIKQCCVPCLHRQMECEFLKCWVLEKFDFFLVGCCSPWKEQQTSQSKHLHRLEECFTAFCFTCSSKRCRPCSLSLSPFSTALLLWVVLHRALHFPEESVGCGSEALCWQLCSRRDLSLREHCLILPITICKNNIPSKNYSFCIYY